LQDIGPFLRQAIERRVLGRRDQPMTLRYFDPELPDCAASPANCETRSWCDQFARQAVHAAMAGKTGLVVGFLHGTFITCRPISSRAAPSAWIRTACSGRPSLFAPRGNRHSSSEDPSVRAGFTVADLAAPHPAS